MFIVMNRFNVTPGRERDFEDAFKGRARRIDGMPGFVSLDMLRPADGEGVFISMTRWRSQSDFENWTNSEAFKQAHGKRHPGMFEAHPQLETYEVFDSTMEE